MPVCFCVVLFVSQQLPYAGITWEIRMLRIFECTLVCFVCFSSIPPPFHKPFLSMKDKLVCS